MTKRETPHDQIEWLREKEVTQRFGLTHMILFNLRKAGKIRSISLKSDGKKYGARLFSVSSIREFLADQEAKQLSEMEVAK